MPEGKVARRASVLAALLVLQATATVFFVGDAIADLLRGEPLGHVALEATVSVALVLGVTFGALQMRQMLEAERRSEATASAARGVFAELIETRFDRWRLTPAEKDVARLSLKGFDIAGIAALRGAAHGTVRAQLTRIYAKSGVSSRAELLSLFMDDLLDGPLSPARPED